MGTEDADKSAEVMAAIEAERAAADTETADAATVAALKDRTENPKGPESSEGDKIEAADEEAEGEEEDADEEAEAEIAKPEKPAKKDAKKNGEGEKPRDWQTIKADKEYARRKEAERQNETLAARNAELVAELAAAKAPQVADTEKTPAQIREEAVAEARKAAREEADRLATESKTKADQADYMGRLTKAVDAGNETYGKKEFTEASNNLFSLFVVDDRAMTAVESQRLRTFNEAAMATDDPAKVLWTLGQDPEEAERIIALSPLKMAVEMAKLASKRTKKAAAVSEAPPPIGRISGSAAAPEGFGADVSDAVFNKNTKALLDRIASKYN